MRPRDRVRIRLGGRALRRQVDDVAGALGDRLDGRGRGVVGRQGGPYQEHRFDPVQGGFQGRGVGQVAARDLRARGDAGRGGVPAQHTYAGAPLQQLGHDVPAHVAGAPGNQDHQDASFLVRRA